MENFDQNQIGTLRNRLQQIFDIELDDSEPLLELRTIIQARIHSLILTDVHLLMSIFYRVDVKEEYVAQAFKEKDLEAVAERLTELLFARMTGKMSN